MIACNIQGGLANIMFQIAAVSSLAKDNNVVASFPNFRAQIDVMNRDMIHNPKLTYAQDYASAFKNLNIVETGVYGKMVTVPFGQTAVEFEDGATYSGFFQCEKFFAHNRDFILHMYEANDDIKKYISEKYEGLLSMETCGIHVRRGDYLKFQKVHHVLNIEYYKKAFDSIGNVDAYLVFSDDLEWCRDNFKGDKFIFIDGEKDYVDLFLMSMCKHQIVSNSSFSWWAAWLNQNQNKKIVGPLKWFNDSNINSKDILPNNWIKL